MQLIHAYVRFVHRRRRLHIPGKAPGVLFYYSHVSDLAAGSNTLLVNQTRTSKSGDSLTPYFSVQKSQVTVYNASDCSTSNLRPTITTGDGQTVTIGISGATAGQDLIVGIKYNPGSVVGTVVGSARPVTNYNFITSLNGAAGETDPDGVDLRPKP